MKKGKYEAPYVPKRHNGKKALAVLLSLMLVIGCVVGGTLAWLKAVTNPVTNTFIPANIEISLTETNNTDTDNDGNVDAWTAQLVPGKTYSKDPVVGVADGTDVDCYLFVQVEKTGNPDTCLTYTSLLNEDAGWKQVPEVSDVWYRVVKVSDTTKSWHLIGDDQVTVKQELTKENMPQGDVQLSYTAYAVQYAGFEDDVAGAWTAARG